MRLLLGQALVGGSSARAPTDSWLAEEKTRREQFDRRQVSGIARSEDAAVVFVTRFANRASGIASR